MQFFCLVICCTKYGFHIFPLRTKISEPTDFVRYFRNPHIRCLLIRRSTAVRCYFPPNHRLRYNSRVVTRLQDMQANSVTHLASSHLRATFCTADRLFPLQLHKLATSLKKLNATLYLYRLARKYIDQQTVHGSEC